MFNIMFAIINTLLLLYFVIIIMSFDQSDPGWMQLQSLWHGSIYNQGGIIGAQIADFLFFCYGNMAYSIPIIILFYIWILFIEKININCFRLCLLSLIVLVVFIVSCILAQLIFKDVVCFPSGGIIGHILYDILNTNYNIMLYLIYILYYVGVISIAYFFLNFFLFYCKIIKKKYFVFYI